MSIIHWIWKSIVYGLTFFISLGILGGLFGMAFGNGIAIYPAALIAVINTVFVFSYNIPKPQSPERYGGKRNEN